MQITFDPTDKREADFVLKMLGGNERAPTVTVTAPEVNMIGHLSKALAKADRPDVGAEVQFQDAQHYPVTPASAAPLPPPAPSTAAADVFPIAPAAPLASVPKPPPAPPAVAPTAPPPAAAPSASPAAPSVHASGVQLDKEGLPHDVRIHSEKPTLTESGVWRKKRGLNDEAYVKEVKEQLRALMSIPVLGAAAPSAAPLVPPPAATATEPVGSIPSPSLAPASVPPPPVVPSAATASVPPPPVIPATPAAVPVPPVPAGAPSTVPTAPPAGAPASTPVPNPTTFAELMKLVTNNITQRKLTEDEVNAELRNVGLGNNEIGKLNMRMDLGAIVGANLAALVNSRGG